MQKPYIFQGGRGVHITVTALLTLTPGKKLKYFSKDMKKIISRRFPGLAGLRLWPWSFLVAKMEVGKL